ncbi:3979_t:CDS:2 [Rhizophagus irregularis]|nr:3979_t:CDS:2 [Rhizophagus irregularis]
MRQTLLISTSSIKNSPTAPVNDTTTATPDISLTASIHAPAQGELNIPLQ